MTDDTGAWHISGMRGGGGYYYDKKNEVYRNGAGERVTFEEYYQNKIAPDLQKAADKFYSKYASKQGLTIDETDPYNCLGVIIAYALRYKGQDDNITPLGVALIYCQLKGSPFDKFDGYKFDAGEFEPFFNRFFVRGEEHSPIDAINNGHPSMAFNGLDNDNGHVVLLIGYNSENFQYYYIDPIRAGIQNDMPTSNMVDHTFYSIQRCRYRPGGY